MKTSVVIPCKNNIATIDKCLSSLMPYFNAGYISEIVVVDGHSTDGTLELLKKYPVRLLFEQVAGNIGMAYEFGWRNTKEELVIFFDSDVFMEDGFFPKIFDLLSDNKIGWVSCQQKAVITNKITKAQGQDWVWSSSGKNSRSKLSFRSLYNRIAYGSTKKHLCGGPCMVVRRACLEAIDGLNGLNAGTIGLKGTSLADICYSQRIVKKGWEAIWWTDAPILHHPRPTFKEYNRQMYGYGKAAAYMQLEPEFQKDYPWQNKVISLLARLASPFIGIYLAIRYLNPYQLIIYPVPRFYWAWGYISGWIAAKKPDQPIYSEPGTNPSK
jgi:glycosyltransferase involved in cell wall biosynthesis